LGITAFKLPFSKVSELANLASDKIPLGAVSFALYKASGMAENDAITYLDQMAKCMEVARLAPHQRQKEIEAVEAELRGISKGHILLHLVVPALSKFTTWDLTDMARLGTAQAAIAIERYRLATGNLPDGLADLLPAYLDAIPKDPFDGKDLRYRKLDAGFVVYSVGKDERDDGGKKRRGERFGFTGSDLTFVVER
jgi:hypothetical protein